MRPLRREFATCKTKHPLSSVSRWSHSVSGKGPPPHCLDDRIRARLSLLSPAPPPNIDSDFSHRPLESRHSYAVYPSFPPGARKKSSTLFAGDNPLYCRGCRPSFRERELDTPPLNPQSTSVCDEPQDAVVTADLRGVLPG